MFILTRSKQEKKQFIKHFVIYFAPTKVNTFKVVAKNIYVNIFYNDIQNFHHMQQIEEFSLSIRVAGAHRRKIDLEDKAKVVAYAWGAESLPR